MLSNRNMKYYIIAFALITGLAAQVIKSMKSNPKRGAIPTLSGSEMADFDFKPYHASKNGQQKTTLPRHKHRMKLMKKGPKSKFKFPEKYSFNEGMNAQGKKKKKSKHGKKKKKITKKKKKKKKNLDKLPPPESTTDESDEKEAVVSDNESSSPDTGTGENIVFDDPTSTEKDDPMEGYDEWAELLLVYPNFKDTIRLIEEYKTKQLSEELFYRLVDEMIADGRSEMVELGVMAAEKTPSPRSFVKLANVMSGFDHGSTQRVSIETAFRIYERTLYVKSLVPVLTQSKSDLALIIASQIVEKSAQQNLHSSGARSTNLNLEGASSESHENNHRAHRTPNPTENDGRGTTGGTANQQVNGKLYRQFLPMLAQLAVSSKNTEVVQGAQSALKTINNLLSTSPTGGRGSRGEIISLADQFE